MAPVLPVWLALSLALAVVGAGCDAGGEGAPTAGADETGASDTPASDTPDDDGEALPPVLPDAATRAVYDPMDGAVPTTLPDDLWAQTDPSSETGLRLRVDPASTPWLAAAPETFQAIWTALDGLDGWGMTASLQVAFDGPIAAPEGPEGVAELRDADGALVPVSVHLVGQQTLMIEPLVPLAPATAHELVVTRALLDEGGEPVGPAPTLWALLTAAGLEDLPAEVVALAPRYEALLAHSGRTADDIAAATVFTTQSLTSESLTVAADVAGRSFTWSVAPACEPFVDELVPDGLLDVCHGAFEAHDYRDEFEYRDGTPVATYELQVSIWWPTGSTGARPTVLFGHGIQHGRGVAKAMAALLAPLGVAVVAIDAVAHGEHPDAPAEEALQIMEFFGVSIDPLGANVERLRDNFRQSTWDKLQVLRLLDDHADVDGDGAADLDLDRMAYIGESFGGIMGIEMLALTDRFELAALQTAGGRVTSIVSEGQRFQIFNTLFTPPEGDLDDLLRLYPIVQTVIERGDSANWAPRVLFDRLAEGGPRAPHLLFQTVVEDDTIPDVSAKLLARALGTDHVPPVIAPIALVETTDGPPTSANVPLADAGPLTIGLFQFDRIRRTPDAPVEKASHDYTPGSVEATHQLYHFVATWLDGGPPEIIDPYEALGTPPL